MATPTTVPMVATLMNKRPMKSKKHIQLAAVGLALLAVGCGANKNSVKGRCPQEANSLAREGRFDEAFGKYQACDVAVWDSVTFRLAAIAASETGHDSAACAWGLTFSATGDTARLKALNKSLSNMGKTDELAALVQSNQSVFESIIGADGVRTISARTYAASGDERIVGLYPTLPNEVKAEVFDPYFKKAQAKLSPKELEKTCKDVLKIDAKQKTALRFLGRSKYEEAEAKYAKAMGDYNKNKSQAAYAYLRRDLKKYITPLYTESRTYFERLLKETPEDKTVVKYLININDRLSNDAEVKRLKKLL